MHNVRQVGNKIQSTVYRDMVVYIDTIFYCIYHDMKINNRTFNTDNLFHAVIPVGFCIISVHFFHPVILFQILKTRTEVRPSSKIARISTY